MVIEKTDLKFKKTLQKRKTTKQIIVHCTASVEGANISVQSVHNSHLRNGWAGIGYHYLISADGKIWEGRPDDTIGSHAAPQNSNSIGICYVGGLDENKKPKDTRTDAQKIALEELILFLLEKYPSIQEIKGHRDISPDKNGDGKISKNEWIKSCPCFSAIEEYQHFLGEKKNEGI